MIKRCILFLFLFPSLLFSQGNNFHSKPLFEENKGQDRNEGSNELNPEIRFVLRGGAMTYFFSDRGYSVVEKTNDGNTSRVDFLFEHGQICIPEGKEKVPSTNLHYTASGNYSVASFQKIIYRNVFTGADLEFSVFGDFVKKTVIIHGPGFPGKISFDMKGAAAWPMLEGGYSFDASPMHFSETVFQRDLLLKIEMPRSSARAFFKPEYFLRTNCGNEALAASISWLTYIGGNSSDELFGIALASDSGVVVTGRTSSVDFPSTFGVTQDTFAGNYDAVVTRFDKNGNCLWSAFYGGTNFDGAYQVIAFDSTFVIAGMSSSTDLPLLNAAQTNNAGSYDAFLVTLNDSGQLVRSTYYGGSGSDQGLAIAKGINGEIVLAGSTTSTNLPFASTGFQGTMAGMIDAFITVFDDSLHAQWSTYYGGNNVEDIHTVTVTPQNEIAFAGATRSFDFPVTPNAYQNGLLNQPDNYIVKFSMSGARLYATFFGGTNNEDANGIVGDDDGNLYLSGFTYSADFPTAGTIFQPTILGQNDVYVSRFDSTGQLVWSTYIGGSGQDVAWGMYRLGRYIFICGQTESTTFPVSANAIQSTYSVNSDGFVIKMDTSGQMVCGTFMGGNGVDALLAMVVDADTNVIACGDSYSTDLAVTNPYQNTNAGAGDGYVVKFGMSEQLLSTSSVSNAELHALTIFPNPADETLTIEMKGSTISELKIIDATGRLVKCIYPEAEKITLNVNELSAGIYFIKALDNKSQSHTLRFIVK
jgi:hypothetical protein